MAQLPVLQFSQQRLLVDVQIHAVKPGPQQREGMLRTQIPANRALTEIALAHHSLDDREYRRRVRPRRLHRRGPATGSPAP